MHAGLAIERLGFAITRQKIQRMATNRPRTVNAASVAFGAAALALLPQARWRAFLKNWHRITRRDRRVRCSGRTDHKLRIMRMTTEPDYYIAIF